jgi:N-acetyl sugar amidotransferase
MALKDQICTHCVLDNSEPTITFDEKGICRYCNDYFEISKQKKHQYTLDEKEEHLKKYVDQIKRDGEGKEYDCIIGLSGGVDSSYVAFIAKQQGLRPLAVHLDNGWDAELAVKNIENICNKLDIDLYTHVINWEEFKDLQLSFLKASVANAEAPTDHAIFAVLYHLARKYKLKWIIDGVNHATEYVRSDGEGGGYAYSDLKQIKGIHKKFGKIPLKTYPSMSYYQKLYYKHLLKINQFSILDYVDYNKESALKLLSEQLGWRSYGAKHHESLFTKWHQVVHLTQKFGYDKRKAHLSDLILSGQMRREDALLELAKSPLPMPEQLELEEYVQKKLGLSPIEYQEILNNKPKSYKEYPNDEWIMKAYAKFKSRE